MNTKPFKRIGIFDSGLGGLTVLQPLLTHYPAEYIYVADTANLPYGAKSPEQIFSLSKRIVDFLISHNVDVCIVACHTISSVALEQLKTLYHLPLFGVIDSVVNQAIVETKNNKVGIIGTTATICTNNHKNKLLSLKPTLEVFTQACPRIVPAIEYDLKNKKNVCKILKEDLSTLQQAGVDTLILACTHYTLVAPEIQEIVGNNVQLIAADETVANSFAKTDTLNSSVHYFVTGNAQQFKNNAAKLLNWDLGDVEEIKL